MAGRPRTLWFLLAEGALIVASVLLALGLEAWWTARREAAAADRALTGVVAELTENRSALATSLAYHRDAVAALNEALQGAPPGDGVTAVEWLMASGAFPNGLLPAQLNAVAWDTARDAGAFTKLDYDLRAELRRAYGAQARGVNATWPQIAKAFFTADAHDPARTDVTVSRLTAMLGELAAQEASLITRYDRTLSILEEAP